MEVTVEGASELLGLESGNTCDPYCVATLADGDGQPWAGGAGGTVKTPTITRNTNPIWAHAGELGTTLATLEGAYLCVEVYDWDRFTKPDPLGRGLLPLSAVAVGAEHVVIPLAKFAGMKETATGAVRVTLKRKAGGAQGPEADGLPEGFAESLGGKAANCLRVHVARASGLPAADAGVFGAGSSDPYAELRVAGTDAAPARTKTKKRTLAPVWGETLALAGVVPGGAGTALTVAVFDADLVGSNDLLGTCELALAGLDPGGAPSALHTLALQGKGGKADGKQRGAVDVLVQWAYSTQFDADAANDALADAAAAAADDANAELEDEDGPAEDDKTSATEDGGASKPYPIDEDKARHSDGFPRKHPNELQVVVVRARRLVASDGGGLLGKAKTSDPYVKLACGAEGAKTKTVKKNLHPTWEERFSLPVPNPEAYLDLEVLDHDRIGSHDSLGHASIRLAALANKRPVRRWYTLADETGGTTDEAGEAVLRGAVEVWLWYRYNPKLEIVDEKAGLLAAPLALEEEAMDCSDAHPKERPNELRVVVVRAAGLKSKAGKKASTVYTLNCKGESGVSEVVKAGGLSPDVLQRFTLPIVDARAALELVVHEKNTLTRDELVGAVKIPLATLASKRPRRAFYRLGDANGKVDGAKDRGSVELWVWAKFNPEYAGNNDCPIEEDAQSHADMDSDKPPNWLGVVLVRGRRLQAMDFSMIGAAGSSDPFVQLTCAGDAKKSGFVKKSLAPVWKERFGFAADGEATLDLTVFDKDWGLNAKDDFMGRVLVPLKSLGLKKAPKRAWFKLGNERGNADKTDRGDVELWLRWYYNPEASNAIECPIAEDGLIARLKTDSAPGELANELDIVLIRAKNLIAKDGGGMFSKGKKGTSDPLVHFKLGKKKDQKAKSTTILKNLNPVWKERFSLSASEPDATLLVTVEDSDTLSNDFMGKVEIPLADLGGKLPLRKWYKFVDKKGKSFPLRGEVELFLHWTFNPERGDDGNNPDADCPIEEEVHAGAADPHPNKKPNELKVVLVRARDLLGLDLAVFGSKTSDPFATLTCTSDDDKPQRSEAKLKTLNPVWRERFNFAPIDDTAELQLVLEDQDRGPMAKNDFLGKVIVPVGQLLDKRAVRSWFTLSDKAGSTSSEPARGQVELWMQAHYNPEAAQDVDCPIEEDAEAPGTADLGKAPNELRVVVVRGRKLLAVDKPMLFGTASSDPRVTVGFKKAGSGDRGGFAPKAQKTTTKKKNLNPVYKERFVFPMPEDGDPASDPDALCVLVEDIDALTGSDFMGKCEIDLAALRQSQKALRKWYPLGGKGVKNVADPHEGARGKVEVWVRCCYNPERSVGGPMAIEEELHPIDDAAVDQPPNQLKVCLVRARGLPKMDLFGKSDPRVTLSVGSDVQRSSTKANSLSPVYKERFAFPLEADAGVIEFLVEDSDSLTRNDFMGRFAVDLASFADRKPVRAWHSLVDRAGNKAGKLGELDVWVQWWHNPDLVPDSMEDGDLDFDAGDYVHAKWRTGAKWYEAEVLEILKDTEQLLIEYSGASDPEMCKGGKVAKWKDKVPASKLHHPGHMWGAPWDFAPNYENLVIDEWDNLEGPIAELLSSGHGLDLDVIYRDATFRASRLVLASRSEMFRNLFDTKTAPPGAIVKLNADGQVEVGVMRHVHPHVVELLLKSTVSASVQVGLNTAAPLLEAAMQLQLTAVVTKIIAYTTGKLTLLNWNKVLETGVYLSLQALTKPAAAFARDHLAELVNSEEIFDLPFEDLEPIMAAKSADRADADREQEEQTFLMLCQWAETDEEGRDGCLQLLLKHVAFKVLAPEFLIQQMGEPIVSSNPDAFTMIQAAVGDRFGDTGGEDAGEASVGKGFFGSKKPKKTAGGAPKAQVAANKYSKGRTVRRAQRLEEMEDAVKYEQCRTNVYRPTAAGEAGGVKVNKYPATDLALDYTFGYHCVGTNPGRCQNLFTLPTGEIMWYTSGLVVLERDDPGSQDTQRFFVAHDDEVTALALHPGGEVVASGQKADREVRGCRICVWRHRTPPGVLLQHTTDNIEGELLAHEGRVISLDFSHDGKLLVSLGADEHHTAIVWDWQAKSKMCTFKTGSSSLYGVRFNPYQAYGIPDYDTPKPGQAAIIHDAVYCLASYGIRHLMTWVMTHVGDGENLTPAQRIAAAEAPSWKVEGNMARCSPLGSMQDMISMEFVDDSAEILTVDKRMKPKSLPGTSDRVRSRIVVGTRAGDLYVFLQPFLVDGTEGLTPQAPWWLTKYYMQTGRPDDDPVKRHIRTWDDRGSIVAVVPATQMIGDKTLAMTGEAYIGPVGQVGGITSLSYSRPRRLLASAGVDGTVKLWNPFEGGPGSDRLFQASTETMDMSSTLPDLPLPTGLMSTHSGAAAKRAIIPGVTPPEHMAPHFRCLVWEASGKALLAGTNANDVYRLHVDTSPLNGRPSFGDEVRMVIKSHCGSVDAVDTHPSKNQFVTVGKDARLALWDIDTRSYVTEMRLPREATCVAFNPVGSLVAVGMRENEVMVAELCIDPHGRRKGDSNPTGARFEVRLHRSVEDTFKREVVGTVDNSGGSRWKAPKKGRKKAKRNALMASSAAASTKSAKAVQEQRLVARAPGLSKLKLSQRVVPCVTDVKFSPSGEMLAVASQDRAIYLFAVDVTRTPVARKTTVLRKHTAAVTRLDWSVDGRFIQSNSADYEALHWEVLPSDSPLDLYAYFAGVENPDEDDANDPTKFRPRLHKRPYDLRDADWESWTCPLGWPVQNIWPDQSVGDDINAVDRSHRRDVIVTADDFQYIRLMSFPCIPGVECKPYRAHSESVTGAKFTHNDSYVVSIGGADNTILVWRHTNEQGGVVHFSGVLDDGDDGVVEGEGGMRQAQAENVHELEFDTVEGTEAARIAQKDAEIEALRRQILEMQGGPAPAQPSAPQYDDGEYHAEGGYGDDDLGEASYDDMGYGDDGSDADAAMLGLKPAVGADFGSRGSLGSDADAAMMGLTPAVGADFGSRGSLGSDADAAMMGLKPAEGMSQFEQSQSMGSLDDSNSDAAMLGLRPARPAGGRSPGQGPSPRSRRAG